jgi:hypothetical protein
LVITGGALVTAAAVADALGAVCPVDTVAAAFAAGRVVPVWRRAAASTTQDTGDSAGAPGLTPKSGLKTESTVFTVFTAGWAATAVATGGVITGVDVGMATNWAATGVTEGATLVAGWTGAGACTADGELTGSATRAAMGAVEASEGAEGVAADSTTGAAVGRSGATASDRPSATRRAGRSATGPGA